MDYLSDIIGQTPGILQALEVAMTVAPTDTSVLIIGKTGTGKGLFAKAIHNNSKRENRPFVTINCGAKSDGLLEAELFGHTQGAFTGAIRKRVGKLEYADKGTVFLDEIGDMPFSMQSILLQAIEQKEFTPLGQNAPISSDFRIICATNKNLVDCVADGSFREDLYYRINLTVIELPPLRSRRDDIPRLARHFTARYCEKNQNKIRQFSPQALKALQQYSWPGNIRELKNVCKHAVIFCKADKIDLSYLPDNIINFKNKPLTKAIKKTLKEWYEIYNFSLHTFRNLYIEVVFEANGRNKSKTAKALGISRTTLNKLIGKLNLV